MQELLERIFLWMMLTLFFYSLHPNSNLSAFILAGFIISIAGLCTEWRFFTPIYSTVFFLATAFFPWLGIYSGLVLFHIFYMRDKWFPITLFPVLGAFTIFLAESRTSPFPLFFSILLTGFCCYLSYIKNQLVNIKKQLNNIHDDNEEKSRAFSKQYENLKKQQNNELLIATLKERGRIAREIHDNVGHTLSRSILQLGALLAVHKNTPFESALLPLKDSLDEAMNNIRNSVHDLHNESVRFSSSVRQMIDQMQNTTQITVDFSCDFNEKLPTETAYTFLTITKEAFTNVRRHSNADKIKVLGRELSDYYQLIIEDNGTVKNNINNIKHQGIGLKNMEERIADLNGMIYFSNEHGFRIFISVPKN